MDAAPDRLLRDGERRPVLLQADVGIALLAQAHEVAVVDPLLLQELQGGHRLGADEDEVEPAGGFVVLRRDRVRVVGCPVGRAAPDDAVDVHVREDRQLGVARVHPPHVRAERHLPAVRIGGIGEVVVPPRVRAELRVVLRRRERQRRAAAPAPHQLRREQLPLLLRPGVLAQEAIERPDARLVLTQPGERAVPSQHVGLRHRQRHAGLAGIAEDELAGLDRRSLAGQRIDAAALDRGLADRVLVAERVEVTRLGAEVLRRSAR